MFKFAVIVYRILFALLIITTVTWQLSDRAFGPGFSIVNFFSYFSILSNLFLAAMFLTSAWIGRRGYIVATLRGASVLFMVTTGIVYATMLAPLDANVGITAPWVDTVLHQIMPAVALLDWLLVPPHKHLRKRTLIIWTFFPLLYLAYTLVRGHITGWYPYPFLDPAESGGYLDITAKCIGVAISVLLLGWLVAWTGNRLRTYAKLHPHHYPHFVDSNIPAVDWTGMRRSKLVALLAIVIISTLAVGAWGTFRMWHGSKVYTEQNITNTNMPNVRMVTDIYRGDFFEARANYPLTANTTINNSVRHIVDDRFQPCRRKAQSWRTLPPQQCLASFDIVYETPNYLALVYTHRQNEIIQKQSLLFNKQQQTRVDTAELFRKDAPYLKTLSIAARSKLNKRFANVYSQNTNAKALMLQATKPEEEYFANFLLKDEHFYLLFDQGTVASTSEGPVQIALDTNQIFGQLRQDVIDQFFPKLKKKKEKERQAALQALADAHAAELARQHARGLVAPNRANINCANMKCISLTFDDGPSPFTQGLLDILSARKAVATFFVLGGSAKNRPEILQRIAQEKSEVANHSWSHANLTLLSDQHVADEIELTNNAIFDAIGTYPKLMRPPYGAYDDRVIAHIGMPIAMWSIDTNDWKQPGASALCDYVIANASQGAVVLMHDIHAASVAAVPCIIDELQRQGYVFVTMSELFDINSGNVQVYSGNILRKR